MRRLEQIKQQIIDEEFHQRKLENTFVFGDMSEHRSDKIIVSFRLQEDRQQLEKAWRLSNLGQISLLCFGCIPFQKEVLILEGLRVKAQRAPEPLDILWENLEAPFRMKFGRRIKTILVSILILALSFAILYGITYAQVIIDTSV